MTEKSHDIIQFLQQPNPYSSDTQEHQLFEHDQFLKKNELLYSITKKSTPHSFPYMLVYSLNDGEMKNVIGCHSIEQSREIGRMLYNNYLAMDFMVDFVVIFDNWDYVEKVEVTF